MQIKTAKRILYITRGITITLLIVFSISLLYKTANKDNNTLLQTQEKCATFIQNNIKLLSPTSVMLVNTQQVINIEYATGSTTAIVNYKNGDKTENISVECLIENKELKIGAVTLLSTQ